MSGKLAVLRPGRADPFPPLHHALDEPNGLLAVGGDLTSQRLIEAYRQGIFPWYSEDQPLLWWSPDPRMVLFPEQLRVSRSLAKLLRGRRFRFSTDQAFDAVIQACAARRDGADGTWITSAMQTAYCELHRIGMAHSVEAWQDDVLVGGLYGVALGRVFFGESMFFRVDNASKAAFVHLVACLRAWHYVLIDCQVETAHLQSLGAENIPRRRFGELLQRHCNETPGADAWQNHGNSSTAAAHL